MAETIKGEPVELVTDFATLQVADVLWCKPCAFCGGEHRSIVVALLPPALCSTGEAGRFWEVLPGLPCLPLRGFPHARCAITPRAVGKRIVWRVINPPAAADDAEPARAPVRRQKARAR